MQTFRTGSGRAPTRRPAFLPRTWRAALALLTLGLLPGAAQAQTTPASQLVTARYWFDSGTKTTMTAADGAFDSALESALSVAAGTLSVGAHALRIEMQGADGSWGPVVTSTVAVVSTTTRAVNIQSGEVQLDATAAVAVTATDGAFNAAVEDVVKAGLTAGALGNHTIKIRLKDAQGNNGPWFTSAYALLGTVSRSVQIASGEVQIDNGTAVAVTALDGSFNDVVETVVKGALAAGTAGNHTIKIRLKDAQGAFGPWFTSAYAVLGTVSRSVQVLSGEVQIDATTAVAVTALDGSFNSVLEDVIKGALAAGAAGSHTVKIRLKDAQGNNGPWFTSAYAVLGTVARTIRVQSARYWVDGGAKTTLTALDGSFDGVLETAFAGAISGLAAGPHTLNVELQDAQGNWGPTFSATTSVLGSVTRTVSVQSGETWWDADATHTALVLLNGGAGDVFASASLALSTYFLAPGAHALRMRLRDAAGQWGPTVTSTVQVYPCTPAPAAAPTASALPTTVPANQPVTLSVSSPVAGLTYQWQGPGLLATSGTSVTAVPTTAGTAAYKVVAVSSGGCPGPAATVNVTVTAPSAAPSITSFSPATGPVGTAVALTGTNFTGTTSVKFNGTVATYTVVSATSITTTVPTGATSGLIAVTNGTGTGSSSTAFYLPPTLASFSPASAAVGATVTLTGTNFSGTSGVTFNGVAATSYTVVSNTTLTAVVPATATTGTIKVTAPGGTATSALAFKVLPTVSSFTPGSGTPYGTPTVVTITGTGFLGATAVKFGSGTATAFTVVSSTSITATVPVLAVTGKISVTTAGGTGTSAGTFNVSPTITSFTPGQGSPGSVVLVFGRNFTTGTTSGIQFNGVPATTVYNSTTQLTATVPATATTGPLTVTTPYGSHTSAASYTVTAPAPPTITSFSPTASVIKGTLVTITGTNFTGATLVRFNNVNATGLTVLSDTQVQAAVPTGAVTGKVYVATPSGMAQSAANLTIVPAPTLTSFSPTSGSVGSVVLLAGANYSGATFPGVTSVTLNGASVPFAINSASQLVVTLPAGATTGKFSVTTLAGTVTSTATFTVTTTPAPTITSFSPASGAVGMTVVLTGTNFTGATQVKFNATAAAVYTVDSPTQLTATIPVGATTGKLYVTAPGGMAQSATSFTIVKAPTLSSFAPSTGGAPGSTVILTGTNLTGAASVTFGGVPATSFTVVSATQITVTVPSGAVTGPIQVTNAGGSASTATFTVTSGAAPTITVFTPTSGPVGGVFTITGSGLTGATSVKVNATAATAYTVASATSISVTVPTGATTGKVTVVTPNGMVVSTASFTVTAAPTVSSFTPTAGPVGTLVTINGSNLAGIGSVRFGGVAATSFTVVSSTRVTATVPAGAGTGTIQVANGSATATSAASFTVTGVRPLALAAETAPLTLTVQPNPAHGWVEVQLTGAGANAGSLELFDATGRRLSTALLPADGATRLSLEAVPAGVYFVRCGLRTVRLVVE